MWQIEIVKIELQTQFARFAVHSEIMRTARQMNLRLNLYATDDCAREIGTELL